MSVIELRLPERLQKAVDREVAAGRAETPDASVIEAVRRFVEELELEDEIAATAEAGIADAAAGRFTAISTEAEHLAFHDEAMDRVRHRLGSDAG